MEHLIQSKNKELALKAKQLETPLGPMLALADEKALYLLEFFDRKKMEFQLERFLKKTNANMSFGETEPVLSIEQELADYFSKKLTTFKTPLFFVGSPFQQHVWRELQQIPCSETISYATLATRVGNPLACRAVARANSTNPLAIIVPCHRVINSNGQLGGYASGLTRKQWLIEHEQQMAIFKI